MYHPTNQHNNFDFLRFLAASMVVWSHAFPLSGRNEGLGSFLSRETLGDTAVTIFFIISGFLVTSSLINSSGFYSYLKKRLLRIYPAFFVSVLLCFFIIAPIASSQPVREFFLTPEHYTYLKNLWMYQTIFNINNTFEHNPQATSINGPYWTLKIEFAMYIVIALIAALKLLRPLALIMLWAIAMVLYATLSRDLGGILNNSAFTARYSGVFLISACIYIVRDRVPWKFPYFLGAIILLVICQVTNLAHTTPTPCIEPYFCSKWTSYSTIITTLLLPYLVLYVATQSTPFLRSFGKYGDFSYGIYLYGYPVQQLVVHVWGAEMPVIAHFLLTMSFTLALAALSWHFIEKPCLNLKKRFAEKDKLG